ncbi:MAG: TIR domain-containing protein, partial [Candidatus Thiodiazotropha sp. (ex Notomyrtea botanica)]|nr:TIR domain-containing protein [Candidatus Thiodiazotropha sp. (ex Notomyrtea botanica)]
PDIPEPLINLAGIGHFNLFVSTTFDDLLERSINQVRFNGQARTLVIPYSPKHIPSDRSVSEALSSGRPVVFQLFGSCKNPLQFALTDGDMVEYMHALQSAEYCPKRMFDELYERPLLLLGNRFPDWLTRLFLRMTRKIPLDHRDVPKQYVADTETTEDPALKFFLRHFTTNTELVEELDPISFTRRLVEKWQEKYGDETDLSSTPETLDATEKPMPRNSVFISYCSTTINEDVSEDSQIALKIRDALEAAGINVWLDKHQLQGGDEYERKIQRYIKTCSLFMPLVSEITESRSSGFFRKEWSWALNRLPDFTGADRQFLFPIAIGDIDPYNAAVPEEFKRYQFTRLPSSGPDEDFISNVRALYEKVLADASGRASQ